MHIFHRFSSICFTRGNLFQNVAPPPSEWRGGTNARFVVTQRPHLSPAIQFIPLTYPYDIIHASRRHIVPRGSERISGEHKTRREPLLNALQREHTIFASRLFSSSCFRHVIRRDHTSLVAVVATISAFLRGGD